MKLTAHEESELRALVDTAFDARGTDAIRGRVDEIEAWYLGLPGRRLALRVVAGEQFLQHQGATPTSPGGSGMGPRPAGREGG